MQKTMHKIKECPFEEHSFNVSEGKLLIWEMCIRDSINPVATMADGDSIYAASIGNVSVDINMAGTLAAEVMAQAIQNAIHTPRIPDEEFLKYV